MEYTLQELNKKANLNSLKIGHFTDSLNLIGTEVDDLVFELNKENKYLTDVRILLKIPANREDLMNEFFLLNEFSNLFSFSLKKKWDLTKRNYSNYLNQIYNQSKAYKTSLIISSFPEIKTYIFETNWIENFTSPKWVQKKLQGFGANTKGLFDDIIELVFFEWGQKVSFLQTRNKSDCFSLEQIETQKAFEFANGAKIQLPKGAFILKDQQDKPLSFLGYSQSTNAYEKHKKLTFQLWFYDIHQNKYEINPLEKSISLKIFRQSFEETIRYSIQRFFTLLEVILKQEVDISIYKSETNIQELKQDRILAIRRNSSKKMLSLDNYDISIFERAGFIVSCQTKNKIYLQISNVRRDLNREIDLIEEYTRFIGYKNFKEISPVKNQHPIADQIQKIKRYFLFNGFYEIQTSPLQENSQKNKFKIGILNPLSGELDYLRSEIISSCLILLENNSRIRFEQARFFEIGRTFHNENAQLKESEKIGGVFQVQTGSSEQEKQIGWFKAKAIIENFLQSFGYDHSNLFFSYQKTSAFDFAHPTRVTRVIANNKVIGIFGQIHPKKEKRINSKVPTYFFEFDLKYFPQWRSKYRVKTYENYSKYPSIIRDLSFVFSQKINFSEVKKQLLNLCPQLIRTSIFDVYFEKEHSEKIRLGLRLEFQSKEKTLLAEEIEKELVVITNFLITSFNGQQVG